MRAYKVGVDLNTCTTQPGPDGIIKCKDWEEIFRLGNEYDMLQGKTLAIVAYDLEKAPTEALQESAFISSALQLKDTTLHVILLTSTGKSRSEEIMKENGLALDVSFRDRTMLKTIIRSNPGYMLLRDGVILKKWHHNDTPSPEVILELLP